MKNPMKQFQILGFAYIACVLLSGCGEEPKSDTQLKEQTPLYATNSVEGSKDCGTISSKTNASDLVLYSLAMVAVVFLRRKSRSNI